MSFLSSKTSIKTPKAVVIGFVSFVSIFLSSFLTVFLFGVSSNPLWSEVTNTASILLFFVILTLVLWTSVKSFDSREKIALIAQRKTQLQVFLVFLLINLFYLYLLFLHDVSSFKISAGVFDHYFGFSQELITIKPRIVPASVFPGNELPYSETSRLASLYKFLLFRVLFVTCIQFFILYLVTYASLRESQTLTLHPKASDDVTSSQISVFQQLILFIVVYVFSILLINQIFWLYLSGLEDEGRFFVHINYKNVLLGLEAFALLVALFVSYGISRIVNSANLFRSQLPIRQIVAIVVGTRIIFDFLIMLLFSSGILVVDNSLLQFPVTNLYYFEVHPYDIGYFPSISGFGELVLILKELISLVFVSMAFVGAIFLTYSDKIDIIYSSQINKGDELEYPDNNALSGS